MATNHTNTVVGVIALEDESKAAMSRLSDALDRFASQNGTDASVPEQSPPTAPQIIEWEPRSRPPRLIATCPGCGAHVDTTAETFEMILPDDGTDAPTRVYGRLRHDHEDGSVTTWPYIADEPKPDIEVEIDVDVPGWEYDRDEPFAFTRESDGSLSLSSAVHQALGAASVCWESMAGTGIFDEARANEIGAALLHEIEHGENRAAAWLKVVTHKSMHQLDQREGEAYSDAVVRRLDRAVEDAERVRYYAPRLQMTRSAIAKAYDRMQGIGFPEANPTDTRRLVAAGAILRDVMDRESRTTQPSDIEVGGQWMTQEQFDAASAVSRTEAERAEAERVRLDQIIYRARTALSEHSERYGTSFITKRLRDILVAVDDTKGGE